MWHVGPPRRLLGERCEHAALTPDGRRLAVQSFGRATVLDPSAPRPTVQVLHHNLSRLSLSPDGRWLATGTHNGQDVKVSDAQTGRPAATLPFPGSANVAFSPDGKWLVTYCRGKYRVHATGTWEGQTLVIDTIAFEPNPSGIFINIPSSPRKHTIERLTLTEDRTRLRYETTVEDPEYLDKPASFTMLWDHRPDLKPSPRSEACDQKVARRYLEY